MNAKHTPGPFKFSHTNSGYFISGSVPGYFIEVRHCRTDQDVIGDAKSIVRKLNVHDALVAALKPIAEHGEISAEIINNARAAIAKATQ